ncbi:MAG: methionyl-tRNA formyltransferase [Pseudomonadota bacterium]
MSGPLRVVFMGSPEFAGPSLRGLAGSGRQVVMTVTQPDRPQGRGRKTAPPYIKTLAGELGLPVWQPDSIRGPEVLERFRELAPDILVVVAYGRLLPPGLLGLTRLGPLNVHPSLLPAYRGPAPINWAVINGETETGVTTMLLDRGLDTGPTLLSVKVLIEPDETAGRLHDRLAVIGADLLLETIEKLQAGTATAVPQPEAGIKPAPLLKKADGRIDWNRPAEQLACQVRGLDPWPGSFTAFRGTFLKLFGAVPGPGRGRPGTILALDSERLHVAAGTGSLAVGELQLAGRKKTSAREFWHGQRISPGDVLGD